MNKDDINTLELIADHMMSHKGRKLTSIIIANEIVKDSKATKAMYYMQVMVDLKIVDPIYKPYGDKKLEAIKYSYALDKFLEKGGFVKYMEDQQESEEFTSELNDLKKQNLLLNNEKHEYEKTIREQERQIRNLTKQNLTWSLIQKYWWAFGIAFGLGVLISKIFF